MRKNQRIFWLLRLHFVLVGVALLTGCSEDEKALNLVPAITSLSPSSVTAGAAAQTLTINGSNFLSTSTVTYNGVAHTATFVSSTQLTISLSASDQATPGSYPVVVTNAQLGLLPMASSGGGASNSVNFTVNNGVPAITSLSPSSVTAGAAAQTLAINGSNFLSTSTVTYNGVAHTATFVSSTQLTISLSASDQATPGTYPVVVTNPSSGGGASNSVNFTVNNGVPAITSLSPSSVTAGAAAQTLTINGSNFLSTSTVTYNGVAHTATFVSSTQLTISLSASDQATAGNYPVVVTNPAPGGGVSNSVNLTVGTVVPAGSCQPSSSLAVLVDSTAKTVVSYVPKGSWGNTTPGVSVVNLEGSSITPTAVPTANGVNSCASNPVTGQTVCTADNTDVYLLAGTTLGSTLTSGGSGLVSFSGGSCTNCGVAIDAVHNKALIGLSINNGPGFQILDLAGPTFETAFVSPAGVISEDPLIDPTHGTTGGSGSLVLSAAENGNYEIIDVTTSTSPSFFEQSTGLLNLDSSGEDCTTGIVLAPAEFSTPSMLYIADLTQARYTAGSPGSWTAASQIQTLSESVLTSGANGLAVATGTHTGIVTGEFGGDAITAIALPSASGSGTPAITDWVTCSIGGSPTFVMGRDPHTVNAYQSPNSGHAIGVLADGNAATLAVVDLTMMLDPTVVPRTAGGHGCASTTLPASVVSFIPVP
jgi:hypothetical protein